MPPKKADHAEDSDDDTAKLNEDIAKMAADKKVKKEKEEEERLAKLGTNIMPNKEGAGVLMLTTKPGDATHFPQKGDTCKVHYVGTLDDGTMFDSSRAREQAFTFTLGKGMVIRAWDEAVKLMSKGQEVTLTVPPMYGYGVNGYPPIIPANSTLTFQLELISFSDFTREK